jgi:ATP synthase protein I
MAERDQSERPGSGAAAGDDISGGAADQPTPDEIGRDADAEDEPIEGPAELEAMIIEARLARASVEDATGKFIDKDAADAAVESEADSGKRRVAAGGERDEQDRLADDDGGGSRESTGGESDEDTGYILREYRRVMYQFSFIGIEFGVALVIGYLLGNWLDEKLDTAPWLMLVGVALGFSAAGLDFYRLVVKARSKQRRLDEKRRETADE